MKSSKTDTLKCSNNKRLPRHTLNYREMALGYKAWGDVNLRLSEPYDYRELDKYVEEII